MKQLPMRPKLIAATADSRKTQTRRPGGLDEINECPDHWMIESYTSQLDRSAHSGRLVYAKMYNKTNERSVEVKPYFKTGEVCYLGESYWKKAKGPANISVPFFYDQELTDFKRAAFKVDGWHRVTGRFMSAARARHFVRIGSIRLQRIQDISEEDAIAEGIPKMNIAHYDGIYRDSFAITWDDIHGPGAFHKNWWVWVYEIQYLANYSISKLKTL